MKNLYPRTTDSRKLETLYSIGKIISERLDVHFIIQTVIEATTRVSVADIGICCYWAKDSDGRTVHSVAVGGPAANKEGHHIEDEVEGLFQQTFPDRKIVRLDRVSGTSGICGLFTNLIAPGFPPVNHCLAAPIYSIGDELTGTILLGFVRKEAYDEADQDLIHNITSQMTAALENARLFEEVNALNSKKNEFIALASHELKTPLTTVKGYLQILERYEINHIGQRFLAKALKQIDRIEALISELLDISRIEAGKLDLYYETFDIAELVLDVVETFHFSSLTHHIVVTDVKNTAVQADRQRIEQVLINLLSNAIKYSPESDSVFVSLEASERAITVSVTDEGLGMSPEQQAKIFTRFFRAEGTSKMPGLGLGLYLSEQIVERHGGRIGVRSEVGKGSTFYFSIPHMQRAADTARTLFD